MKKIIITTLLLALLLCSCARQGTESTKTETQTVSVPSTTAQSTTAQSETVQERKDSVMNILIGEKVFSVTLEQNDTAAALTERLPLTLQMTELHGNEKYNYLPFSLPTDEKAVGQIHTGDVMLFGDNCLVVFYKDFSTSYAYTKIGTVEDTAGLADALGAGDVQCAFKF